MFYGSFLAFPMFKPKRPEYGPKEKIILHLSPDSHAQVTWPSSAHTVHGVNLKYFSVSMDKIKLWRMYYTSWSIRPNPEDRINRKPDDIIFDLTTE